MSSAIFWPTIERTLIMIQPPSSVWTNQWRRHLFSPSCVRQSGIERPREKERERLHEKKTGKVRMTYRDNRIADIVVLAANCRSLNRLDRVLCCVLDLQIKGI